MSYRIFVTKDATLDVESAYNYYEEQQLDLGEIFLDDLQATLEKTKNDNIEYQKYFDEIRKIKLDVFPYTIYFQKKKKELLIVVGAVLHQKESFLKLQLRYKID